MLLSQVDIVGVWPVILGAFYLGARMEVLAFQVRQLGKKLESHKEVQKCSP